MKQRIHVNCPCKVNLALSVGLPVKGDVRHPLVSWFCAFDLYDELWIEKLEGEAATSGETAEYDIGFINPNTPSEDSDAIPERLLDPIDWPIESDLIVQAHQLMAYEAGHTLPARLTLHKRIPAGAGLGGGSSDAAGTLVGLNKLFNLNVTSGRLDQLARQLGSDVSFALSAMLGHPSALVSGYGEKIKPIDAHEPLHLLLILPSLACSTGQVYGAFDHWCYNRGRNQKFAHGERIERMIEDYLRTADSQMLSGSLFNDLGEPAFQIAGNLRGIQQVVQNDLERPVHVTGSGSTLFAVARDDMDAVNMARQISDEYTYQVATVKSVTA